MITHSDVQLETLFLLALAALVLERVNRWQSTTISEGTVSVQDYLYTLARITGASEYEIFRKSAENWPVSEAMVEEHFKAYLLLQATPCYVNDFVRRHKGQIDELRLPPV